MKQYLLIAVVLWLSSCTYRNSTLSPTLTQIQHFPTAIPSTATSIPTASLTPRPTQTKTVTIIPAATLEPEQVLDTIRVALKEPEDCISPCFLGIIPGQTTLDKARDIFAHLGLVLSQTSTQDDKKFYTTRFEYDDGAGISSVLTIQNDLVTNLRLNITPEKYQEGVERAWLAYSPETLINRYGLPSRVGFWIDWGSRPSYAMIIIFDTVDLIVEYDGYGLGKLNVCPLADPYVSIRIRVGPNPENPPSGDVPIENATSMTIEEFAERMTGDRDKACIDLIKDAFTP